MIQFDTIKFGRTFKNYFGQFVWIEKSHYNSRVSLHEAPTKNEEDGYLKKYRIVASKTQAKVAFSIFNLTSEYETILTCFLVGPPFENNPAEKNDGNWKRKVQQVNSRKHISKYWRENSYLLQQRSCKAVLGKYGENSSEKYHQHQIFQSAQNDIRFESHLNRPVNTLHTKSRKGILQRN